MAQTTIEAIRDAVPRREHIHFASVGITSGTWAAHSFWMNQKYPGGAGVAPAVAGSNPTKATAGALPFTNAGAGNELRLCGIDFLHKADSTFIGLLGLYDRLWASGGHDATSTALVSFTSAITRGDTTGVGCQLWIEIYATIGGTSVTATITYTNSAGVGSRTASVAITVGSSTAKNLIPVELQAGDIGVQSVESVQLSASTTAVGSYGVTLVRPLAYCPMVPQTTERQWLDVLGIGFPKIEDDACLAMAAWHGAAGNRNYNQLSLMLDMREG